MNRLNIILILLLTNWSVGCVANQLDRRTMVVFQSTDVTIDLTDIQGLNMGELYGHDFHMRPKNLGKKSKKSYISRDDVKLAKNIKLQWKISGSEYTETHKQFITRPEKIPEHIPRGHKLIFLHSQGKWRLVLEPLPPIN